MKMARGKHARRQHAYGEEGSGITHGPPAQLPAFEHEGGRPRARRSATAITKSPGRALYHRLAMKRSRGCLATVAAAASGERRVRGTRH